MSMRRIILLAAFAAMAGCYAETTGGVAYSGTVTATAVEPDLVYVSPGVQVIADYDEPIFYSDGFYWRMDNGVWYRSTYYTSGWVYATPPRAIVTINQPYSYRHYRPAGYVPRNRPVRNNDPYVRDHRTYQPEPAARRYDRPEPQPVVRDHRTYDPGPPRAEPARPAPPDVRDHREYTPAQAHPAAPAQPAPVARDHRENAAPPKKDERDHRH
jgi:hypothetical protein